MNDRYAYYRELFKGRPKPFAFVDLDHFDGNVRTILDRAGGMPVRVASKSLRCVALLKRIFAASSQYRGVMAFTAHEAVFLSRQGLDDILVAYPVSGEVECSGVCEALRTGKAIILMADSSEHIEHLDAIGARAGVTFPVCIDVDMSSRYPGLHFGVRRSGVRTPEDVLALWRCVQACAHVSLAGLMGYEAQIAGLPDRSPGHPVRSLVLRCLKRRSIGEVARRRAAVVEALREAGSTLRFVNGGGTGSVESTVQEAGVVTEVTAGSGFYSPWLFDYYTGFRHLPAAGFAIEITRRPAPDIYTCHGGGYVASGAAGPDKLPQPYLPAGAELLPMEGAGEVQTPIRYRGRVPLGLGDPVFLRHSKAGELCERFKTLLLVSDGAIVDEVATYRGDGQCFM